MFGLCAVSCTIASRCQSSELLPGKRLDARVAQPRKDQLLLQQRGEPCEELVFMTCFR